MLTLPIKGKWYDMILSGEKTEEYREIKPYYTTRLRNIWGYPAYWGERHRVCFRNGYSKQARSFLAECTISIGYGDPAWGAAPGKEYYILHIRRIIVC